MTMTKEYYSAVSIKTLSNKDILLSLFGLVRIKPSPFEGEADKKI